MESPDGGDAPLDLAALARRLAAGETTPTEIVRMTRARISDEGVEGVWISLGSEASLKAAAEEVEARRRAGEALPLYGIPFGVKDNIDVAGFPTTAACPAFAYNPAVSAPAVARLCAAGAVVIGKTNMDQFATGLVGVRSPYGIPRNPFDPERVTGGSSSGSAVAVALGRRSTTSSG
jgi:allophanate hydrolase